MPQLAVKVGQCGVVALQKALLHSGSLAAGPVGALLGVLLGAFNAAIEAANDGRSVKKALEQYAVVNGSGQLAGFAVGSLTFVILTVVTGLIGLSGPLLVTLLSAVAAAVTTWLISNAFRKCWVVPRQSNCFQLVLSLLTATYRVDYAGVHRHRYRGAPSVSAVDNLRDSGLFGLRCSCVSNSPCATEAKRKIFGTKGTLLLPNGVQSSCTPCAKDLRNGKLRASCLLWGQEPSNAGPPSWGLVFFSVHLHINTGPSPSYEALKRYRAGSPIPPGSLPRSLSPLGASLSSAADVERVVVRHDAFAHRRRQKRNARHIDELTQLGLGGGVAEAKR